MERHISIDELEFEDDEDFNGDQSGYINKNTNKSLMFKIESEFSDGEDSDYGNLKLKFAED